MVFGPIHLNYQDLAAYAGALARHLLSCGVKPGDRVAVMSSPRPEAIISMFAVWLIGSTWVGINPRYQKEEQRHILLDSKAVAFIAITYDAKRDLKSDLESHKQDLKIPVIRFGRDFWSFDLAKIKLTEEWDDLWGKCAESIRGDSHAVIIYTSGSTGQPKGAINTHKGITFRSWTMYMDRFHVPGMRIIVDLPINHIGALASAVGLALVAGGTMFFLEHFNPEASLRLIETEKIDVLGGVPTMLAHITGHKAFSTTNLSSIRYVSWGGGPINNSVLHALFTATKAEFSQQYGMTETNGPICYTPPTRDMEILLKTTGKPDPRLEVRIGDVENKPVPAGIEGEVQVKMPYPFAGFLNNPEATKAAFTADGFLHTGDLAFIREDGYLVFCGRGKEMFKSGGFNVYPREIEIVMETHPAIKAAVVIGVSDPEWGEVGHAFVEVGNPVSSEEIHQWCKEKLANYKVPKAISIIKAMPRLTVDKVDRACLAALAAKKTIDRR
jgi:fatty-acyl-CoA synthase